MAALKWNVGTQTDDLGLPPLAVSARQLPVESEHPHDVETQTAAWPALAAQICTALAAEPSPDCWEPQESWLTVLNGLTGDTIADCFLYTGEDLDVLELTRITGVDMMQYVLAHQGGNPEDVVLLENYPVAALVDGIIPVVYRPWSECFFDIAKDEHNSVHKYPRRGWRKWYKEFRWFAKYAHPIDLGSSPGRINEDEERFGEAPVRELMPLILQATAWDTRIENGSTSSGYRPWDGVVDSIVLRAAVPKPVVDEWLQSWMQNNKKLLDGVKEAVTNGGHNCYFR